MDSKKDKSQVIDSVRQAPSLDTVLSMALPEDHPMHPRHSPRFSVGDTYPVGDCGKFEAGINHLTPHANEMEFDGKLVQVTKGEAVWFQRITALGNTPEQAEALRDEVLAAMLRAEALTVTPGESSIDNARAWLGGAFHREFKTYIETKLAGDFACALVGLFERKDQEIERLTSGKRFESLYHEAERELAALKAQQPSAGLVMPERMTEEEIHEIDMDCTMQIDFALGIEGHVRSEFIRLNPCRAQSVPDGYVMVPVDLAHVLMAPNANPLTARDARNALRALVDVAAAPSAKQKESGDE